MNTPDHDQNTDQPSPDDAWLETILREQNFDDLPDYGFSMRVLNALPTASSHRWRRPALIASAALLGTLVAFGFGGESLIGSIRRGLSDMLEISNYSLSGSGLTVGVIAILALSAAVSWTAWRKAVP